MRETDRPRSELIPARRRALILERLRLRGVASIHALADDLQVSASTIRRDLEVLTEEGHLERTHGGALSQRGPLATFEPEESVAARAFVAEKAAIGQAAAQRLTAGGSVVLDAGSTVSAAARALVERDIPLTVVTNSLVVARLCGSAAAMRVIVIGGTLRTGSATLWGEPGRAFLTTLKADLCLLGAHAITEGLVTESSLEGADIKRALMGAARRTILLADSSKFQQRSFCAVCTMAELDEVITDDAIAAEPLAALREAAVKVTLVAPRRS
jgi:DeoR/GlpR family transcriptional regulator of sugar metabolism